MSDLGGLISSYQELSSEPISIKFTLDDETPLEQSLQSSWGTLHNSRSADESSVSSFTTISRASSPPIQTPFDEDVTCEPSPNTTQSDTLNENDYVALGTISLEKHDEFGSDPQMMMRSACGNEPYPNDWLAVALKRDWVRIDEVQPDIEGVMPYLRVHVLPEDVRRGNRGSIKDFRKFVKHLLGFVNRSSEAWFGKSDNLSLSGRYETPKSSQEESLFYIFNTLRSPCPDLDCFHISTYGYQAVSDVMNDAIIGLKTQLYPYQRRSVAAMIQREAEPAKIHDPRKPVFTDIHDHPFYLDVSEGVLLKTPPLYNEPRGGILAETMGYGKTLICIAVILATRGHYPRVPENRVDSVPFRPRPKVGSLLEMAARRTKHEGIPWKAEFYRMSRAGYQFDRCLQELTNYEREYAEPIFTPTTPDRKGKRDSANIVRICSGTLIIVPPNLLVQWQFEIQKHTENGSLDVLTVDSPSKEVPPWQELLKYDIVLMTKARFEQEYRDDDLNQGKTRRGETRYRSSLTDVRWLRVICDEGHGFAGSSSRTNAMAMLDKMYIERRWVVSGTPSSTLHGVEVGLSTTMSSSPHTISGSSTPDVLTARQDSLNSALQKRRAPSALDLETKDLERLRLIVVNFLRLQPWANQRGSSDVANWKKYLAPYTDSHGRRHSSPALRDVLQALIIRHRIEDIDTDLTLPALHNRIVYLEPSYHDKLAINMFFMVLASNYVTSEREDEDYMFHPRNRKKLDQLINNLRQASFHWVGFSENDIRETLRISNEYLDKNIDKVSDADGVLLTEAIMNGERALADPSWRAFSTLHEIGVYINRFPEHAREAWALDGSADNPTLLGTVQAREAQRYLKERTSKNKGDVLSGFAGAGTRVMNAAKSRAEDELQAQQKAKARSSETEKQQVGASEEPKLKAPSTSSTSSARSSILKRSRPITPQKRRRNSSTSENVFITPPTSPDPILVPHSRQQEAESLAQTTVSSFTSSKLSYLTSRLLALPDSTKSLVFYQHNNTAFFIAEALELLSIPFRIYANTLSVAQRNAYLADFNSDSSDIKVLLMDVKQASLGLHVACASYVCMVSPIWDAGVESQAIKRAHRIGQTKDVIVETLVLRGTFEEEMVRRRKWKDEHLDDVADEIVDNRADEGNVGSLMTASDIKKNKSRIANAGKSLLDDRHMVSVLKDIKFLKFRKEEETVMGRVREMSVSPGKRLLFKHAMSTELGDVVGHISKDIDILPKPIDENVLRVKFRKLHTHTGSGGTVKWRKESP